MRARRAAEDCGAGAATEWDGGTYGGGGVSFACTEMGLFFRTAGATGSTYTGWGATGSGVTNSGAGLFTAGGNGFGFAGAV